MAIKGQGADGGGASFFSLGSDLDGDLAREPSLSINPAKESHGGLELRLDEIDHAGGNNHFIRFVLTMKGRGCRC
jgi:hypothetical protein